VLTSRPAKVALRSTVRVGAIILLSALTVTAASAADVDVWSCVGGWRGFNCVERSGPSADPYVRFVPQPLDDTEKQRALTRDRKWLDRCRPVAQHDRYGVARYHYAAPGCEFGVSED
jgi:hypothetical protein